MKAPTSTPRRGALDTAAHLSWRFLLIIAALVVLGYILARLEFIVVPIVVGLLIAVVITPVAAWTDRHGLGRMVGAALAYLTALAAIVVLGIVFAPRFLDQFSALAETLDQSLEELRVWLVSGLGLPRDTVAGLFDQAQQQLIGEDGVLRTGFISGATTAGKVAAGTVLTLILSFFFVKDGAQLWRWILRMLPQHRRDDVDGAGRRAWQVLGRYLLGSGANGAIEGAMIGTTLLLVGTPLVVPLVLLQFAGAFFPVVGAVVAGTIAVLVTLSGTDLTRALIVAGAIIVIQQVESNVLAPFVLGGAVRLHPVVVLVVLTTGGILGGVVGAFVAVPLTAVAWAIVRELTEREAIEPSGDREAIVGEQDSGAKESGSRGGGGGGSGGKAHARPAPPADGDSSGATGHDDSPRERKAG